MNPQANKKFQDAFATEHTCIVTKLRIIRHELIIIITRKYTVISNFKNGGRS